jgi:hypothetical protein
LKRIISFSLYGNQQKYLIGAIRNAALAISHYPGWICRFYVHFATANNRDMFAELIRLQSIANTEVAIIPAAHELEKAPMFWRFLPACDPDVERFISRDCDSRVGPEEAAAVNEWIAEDKILHTCRAHPAHGRPINGGMFGLQARRSNWSMPDMMDLIREFSTRHHPLYMSAYGADQQFLGEMIWPWAQESATQHDNVTRQAYPGSKPFPVKWKWPRFMGEVWELDETLVDVPRAGDWEAIKKEDCI